MVKTHLLVNGMLASYTTWLQHGELPIPDESNGSDDEYNDYEGRFDELIEDHHRGTYIEDYTKEREDVHNFDKLLEASQRCLYTGCKDTLLSFIIQMLQVKVENKMSNKAFDNILKIQRQFLPDDHVVPESIYECKKILRDLGLGYELIDACEKDCVLFWKENAHLEKCPICEMPRYKFNDGKGKKIPHKILRYFPLIPRLRRLYMSKKTAEEMRWHTDKRMDDGLMRHPADSEEWKNFDMYYPEFANDARNVRLGLATDGFNPFGNMSTSYSMWPVILMPYNLPPWRCMKEPFFMMALLIPGPSQPGVNIDVYLRPLVDELKELWENGVMTYDASTKQIFRMHAALMWTIHDFPAYGDLSGWRTKGYLACPTCNNNPISRKLIDKIGWVGHRSYLPKNHAWRKDKKFDGFPELDLKSLDLSVEKVVSQLDLIQPVKFGKDSMKKKRHRDPQNLSWTKKSILWELPYWKNLKLRHKLDIMHIEKNICENVYGTMLAIDGKNKDTYKARNDLKNMGIREELHLQLQHNGSFVKPRAAYTLNPQQIDEFCEFL